MGNARQDTCSLNSGPDKQEHMLMCSIYDNTPKVSARSLSKLTSPPRPSITPEPWVITTAAAHSTSHRPENCVTALLPDCHCNANRSEISLQSYIHTQGFLRVETTHACVLGFHRSEGNNKISINIQIDPTRALKTAQTVLIDAVTLCNYNRL